MNVGDPYNPYSLFYGAFIPNWLLCRSEVSNGGKLLFARLGQFAGRSGHCYPSIAKMSEEIGLSERQISEYLSELKKWRLIRSIRRGLGMSNAYEFLWHKWSDEYHAGVAGNGESESPESATGSGQLRQDRRVPYSEQIESVEENQLKRINQENQIAKADAFAAVATSTPLDRTLVKSDTQSRNDVDNRVPPIAATPRAKSPTIARMPQDDSTAVSAHPNGKASVAPEKRKTAKAPKELADPRYAQFTTVWFACHKARGEQYVFNSRDGVSLKSHLKLNPDMTSAEFDSVVKRAFVRKKQLSNFLQDRMLTLHGFLGEFQTIKVRSTSSGCEGMADEIILPKIKRYA